MSMMNSKQVTVPFSCWVFSLYPTECEGHCLLPARHFHHISYHDQQEVSDSALCFSQIASSHDQQGVSNTAIFSSASSLMWSHPQIVSDTSPFSLRQCHHISLYDSWWVTVLFLSARILSCLILWSTASEWWCFLLLSRHITSHPMTNRWWVKVPLLCQTVSLCHPMATVSEW